jgi:hypothetical protein
LAQLSETHRERQADVLSIQEIRFPSIYVKGFATVPLTFSKGFQGTTLVIQDSLP